MRITADQLKAIEDRLAGRAPASAAVADKGSRRGFEGLVLGLDPSLRGTGYGLVEAGGRTSRARHFGTIRIPRHWERSRCLARIAEELRDIVTHHAPAVCVVEGLFHAQNVQTALIMGEARGAALSAVAQGGATIYELAPRKVKQAVVGYGAAGKDAVSRMVQRMLALDAIPEADAGDALALALAWISEQRGLLRRDHRRV